MDLKKTTDLVIKAQNGDKKALNSLFSECYGDLYYFALKTVKDEDKAADAVQDSAIDIMKTIGELKNPEAFLQWSRMIVYRKCTKYFKPGKEIPVEENEDGETLFDSIADEDPASLPENVLEDKELRKAVTSILETLPPEQRAAMTLYYYDGLSVSQIAKIQGVSEGTVKSRLNYARKAVKEKVEEYEEKTGTKLYAAFIPLFLKDLFRKEGTAISKAASPKLGAFTGSTVTSATVSAASGTAANAANILKTGNNIRKGIAMTRKFKSILITSIILAVLAAVGITVGIIASKKTDAPAEPASTSASPATASEGEHTDPEGETENGNPGTEPVTDTEQTSADPLASAKPGDIIVYGHERSYGTDTPLKWTVLDNDGTKLFLISDLQPGNVIWLNAVEAAKFVPVSYVLGGSSLETLTLDFVDTRNEYMLYPHLKISEKEAKQYSYLFAGSTFEWGRLRGVQQKYAVTNPDGTTDVIKGEKYQSRCCVYLNYSGKSDVSVNYATGMSLEEALDTYNIIYKLKDSDLYYGFITNDFEIPRDDRLVQLKNDMHLNNSEIDQIIVNQSLSEDSWIVAQKIEADYNVILRKLQFDDERGLFKLDDETGIWTSVGRLSIPDILHNWGVKYTTHTEMMQNYAEINGEEFNSFEELKALLAKNGIGILVENTGGLFPEDCFFLYSPDGQAHEITLGYYDNSVHKTETVIVGDSSTSNWITICEANVTKLPLKNTKYGYSVLDFSELEPGNYTIISKYDSGTGVSSSVYFDITIENN